MPSTNDFIAALNAFVTATENRIKAKNERMGYKASVKLTYVAGRKNVKIVTNELGGRSVFCFVRIEDGAILKAAGWKAPAKGVRGSIYVNNGQDAVTEYGANYLR